MNDVRKWKITGAVKDKFVATSGKFAKLKIETSIDGRRATDEIKFFEHELIRQIEDVGAGEMLTVEGRLSSELLKDKAGKEVQVDGRNRWVVSLVGDSIESTTNFGTNDSRPAYNPPKYNPPAPKPVEDDDIPF